jgi:hypothetical protein
VGSFGLISRVQPRDLVWGRVWTLAGMIVNAAEAPLLRFAAVRESGVGGWRLTSRVQPRDLVRGRAASLAGMIANSAEAPLLRFASIGESGVGGASPRLTRRKSGVLR